MTFIIFEVLSIIVITLVDESILFDIQEDVSTISFSTSAIERAHCRREEEKN